MENGAGGNPVRRLKASRRESSPKASQAIIAALRADIATGRLARNSRLPNERQLAESFDVSQPTVREALRALEAIGLIVIRHGSGAYVAGDTRSFVTRSLTTLLQVEGVGIVPVLDLRLILGRESARLAAFNATEADIASIGAACDAIDSARDGDDLWESVLSFQVLLSAAAHNPLIYAIESFLVELIVQFQIRVVEDDEVWKQWAPRVSPARQLIVKTLRKRSRGASREAETVNSVQAYLSLQRSIFIEDERFASIVLSDPESVDALVNPLFAIPDYQNIRGTGG